MIEAKELRSKNNEELERLLAEKRQGLWSFRFGTSGGKAKNVKEGRTLRRDVARILTIMHEKVIETKNKK